MSSASVFVRRAQERETRKGRNVWEPTRSLDSSCRSRHATQHTPHQAGVQWCYFALCVVVCPSPPLPPVPPCPSGGARRRRRRLPERAPSPRAGELAAGARGCVVHRLRRSSCPPAAATHSQKKLVTHAHAQCIARRQPRSPVVQRQEEGHCRVWVSANEERDQARAREGDRERERERTQTRDREEDTLAFLTHLLPLHSLAPSLLDNRPIQRRPGQQPVHDGHLPACGRPRGRGVRLLLDAGARQERGGQVQHRLLRRSAQHTGKHGRSGMGWVV